MPRSKREIQEFYSSLKDWYEQEFREEYPNMVMWSLISDMLKHARMKFLDRRAGHLPACDLTMLHSEHYPEPKMGFDGPVVVCEKKDVPPKRKRGRPRKKA